MSTVILTRQTPSASGTATITFESRKLSIHAHDGSPLRQAALDDATLVKIENLADAVVRSKGRSSGTSFFSDRTMTTQISIHDPRGHILFGVSFRDVRALDPDVRRLVELLTTLTDGL